ncbi:ATP-binding protein [Streptomyces mirabilis]
MCDIPWCATRRQCAVTCVHHQARHTLAANLLRHGVGVADPGGEDGDRTPDVVHRLPQPGRHRAGGHAPPGGPGHPARAPGRRRSRPRGDRHGHRYCGRGPAFVFDRFWRAEKSRSRRTGGSGLGLPMARKLTEAHGGVRTAAGPSGKGANFIVRLPPSA